MLSSLQMYGQMFNGQVVDVLGTPIAQAHVACVNEVTTTDEDGFFRIGNYGERSSNIVVTAVGYKEIHLTQDSVRRMNPLIIVMEDSVYALGRVDVVAETPYQVLSEAIIKSLAAIPELEAQTFYRQIHRENDRYVRLIEADVSIQHDKNVRSTDKMQVNQLRRSLVYEKNGDEHGDHIADLLEENVFFNPRGTILDVSVLKQFELFYATDSTRPELTVIRYEYQSGQDAKIREGKVFIDEAGYIIEVWEATRPNPLYWPGGSFGSAGDTHWDFREGEMLIKFSRNANNLLPVSIYQNYLHDISDHYSGVVRYKIEETFELWYHDITIGSTSCKGYRVHGSLYRQKYNYDTAFWSEYEPANAYLLAEDVKSDLERYKPLSEQFLEAGR